MFPIYLGQLSDVYNTACSVVEFDLNSTRNGHIVKEDRAQSF